MAHDPWHHDSDDDLQAAVPAVDEQGARALAAAGAWLGGAVQGVGLGTTADGSRCVVVLVDDSAVEPVPDLPAQVEGMPVRLDHGGPVTARPDDPPT